MTVSTEFDDLEMCSKVLIWCFALSIALILLWFCIIAFAGDLAYRVHSLFFDISRQHFALAHYGGMIFAKVGAFGLFLIPYIALQIVLRGRKG